MSSLTLLKNQTSNTAGVAQTTTGGGSGLTLSGLFDGALIKFQLAPDPNDEFVDPKSPPPAVEPDSLIGNFTEPGYYAIEGLETGVSVIVLLSGAGASTDITAILR